MKRTRESVHVKLSSKTSNVGSKNPALRYIEFASSMDFIMTYYDYSKQWLSAQEQRGNGKKSNLPKPDGSCKPYLTQHLSYYLKKHVVEHRRNVSGSTCHLADNTKRQIRIPQPIRRCLSYYQEENKKDIPWNCQNVTITWLASYLARRFPDRTKKNWENFTCSHLCLSCETGTDMICLDGFHLFWENQSTNAVGRGSRLCRLKCKHCGKMLCLCQDIHNPPCI